ncbi:stage 0 sporulation family protein [Ruminococcaceae bacterium OttesenSCG-928-I18]|nr:stage 0 sporulation family protein [Ruminococcaceae bacterium OttesenSCG-928-I18]
MKKIIHVRFKHNGKSYYFDPNGLDIQEGGCVIVETSRGSECGEVVRGPHEVPDASVPKALKKVVRLADDADIRRMKQNREDEEKAFKICEEAIEKHELPMKLIDVEYTYARNKILFYFTAEGRVDFRELVKDLASVFRTRIELRQIGVRDESKMIGGLGICGQPFCCSRFLTNFQPVSIKMAKEQGLSLNPTKISGSCGRLMCCLAYEQPAYEYLGKITPGLNSVVKTPEGEGTVTEVNLITGMLRVRLENSAEIQPKYFHRGECEYLRGGKRKPIKPEPEEEPAFDAGEGALPAEEESVDDAAEL